MKAEAGALQLEVGRLQWGGSALPWEASGPRPGAFDRIRVRSLSP